MDWPFELLGLKVASARFFCSLRVTHNCRTDISRQVAIQMPQMQPKVQSQRSKINGRIRNAKETGHKNSFLHFFTWRLHLIVQKENAWITGHRVTEAENIWTGIFKLKKPRRWLLYQGHNLTENMLIVWLYLQSKCPTEIQTSIRWIIYIQICHNYFPLAQLELHGTPVDGSVCALSYIEDPENQIEKCFGNNFSPMRYENSELRVNRLMMFTV